MNKKPRTKNQQPGFTLIELLITITIATTLATFGFSTYSVARNKQLIITATTEITTLLDSTQKLALIGTRPADCTGPFMGYQLSITALSNTITTTPLCSTTDGSDLTQSIDNITFDSSNTITFRPLVAGVDLGGVTSLNLDYTDTNSETHRIVLNQSGSHSYEGIQ